MKHHHSYEKFSVKGLPQPDEGGVRESSVRISYHCDGAEGDFPMKISHICDGASTVYEAEPPVAEALEREALPRCMEEADARALAGVFVDMVRQQHAQRRVLVKHGAEQLWKEADQLTDCCRCKRLSYITVAIDNQVSSVRHFPLIITA